MALGVFMRTGYVRKLDKRRRCLEEGAREVSTESDTIDISGLDKAEVLRALFNASRPVGMGFCQPHADEMTAEEARELTSDMKGRFDYVRGRVMKVDIRGDLLEPWLYDRDNGKGAAARVIAKMRGGNDA